MYCTLVVATDADVDVMSLMLEDYHLESTSIVDLADPQQKARRERLLKSVPRLSKLNAHKLVWRRCSKDEVEDNDFFAHLHWVLGPRRPAAPPLSSLAQHQCTVYMDCMWVGSGQGGGPTIERNAILALAHEGLELRIDFYCGDDSNVDLH